MKPIWKTYNIEEWEHGVAGCTPQPLRRVGPPFIWNNLGVCLNPHVLGVAAKGWRIGIYTARNKRGRWVAGSDVSFLNAGSGRGVLNVDADSFPEEWAARSMELRRISSWVRKYASKDYGSCPIPSVQANEALRLISEALDTIEPRRIPIYTQLSLFDAL